AEYREALRLKPDDFTIHTNLGNALKLQGKLDEAIAECRTALRIKPDNAIAHFHLGTIRRREGRFAEALAEFKRAHELGSMGPNWRGPTAQWGVRETEQMLELEKKLPLILSGKLKPADAAETLRFTKLCHYMKLHAASAWLCAEAFQAQPKLANDMQAG